jgi:hypothetical protein
MPTSSRMLATEYASACRGKRGVSRWSVMDPGSRGERAQTVELVVSRVQWDPAVAILRRGESTLRMAPSHQHHKGRARDIPATRRRNDDQVKVAFLAEAKP